MKKDKIKLPSEILESRPELKETQIGILKGLFGIIPLIGPMINEILFDIPGRIYQARINETVKILKEKLSMIDKKYINFEYLKSDDFFDFTRQMIENCIKFKSTEKRKALAYIYIDSIKNEADYDIDNSRLFMDFIVQLSPIQINILKFIESSIDNLKEIASYRKFYNLYLNDSMTFKTDRYKFKYYCNELVNKALISFGAGLEDFDSTSKLIAFDNHIEPSVLITNLGKDFIKYLKE